MFRKRAVQIRLVKNADASKDDPTIADILNEDSIQLIEDAGSRLVTKISISVVAAVAAIKIIDTLCQIAVKKTKSA